MGVFGDTASNLSKACKEIGVTEKSFHEDVTAIKEWLQHQPHLPEIGDTLVVENMLLRSKCSVEVAKQAIDRFFSVRGRFPDLFTDTDPFSPAMHLTNQLRNVCCMKDLTSEGHRIIMTTLPDSKYVDSIHMRPYLKDLLLTLDLLISEDISSGIIFIVNLSAVGLLHSAVIIKNFDIVQKAAYCVFKAYRSRLKALHVISPPPAAQSLIQLILKLAPKKIANRYQVHSDFESLHQHYDKKIFPKDYGGNQKTIFEIVADFNAEIIAHRQWFIDHEKSWLTDESKRPTNSVCANADFFGFNGNFKKLEVD